MKSLFLTLFFVANTSFAADNRSCLPSAAEFVEKMSTIYDASNPMPGNPLQLAQKKIIGLYGEIKTDEDVKNFNEQNKILASGKLALMRSICKVLEEK